MQKMITCTNCDQTKPANQRLKGPQFYCNSKPCQNARKNAWRQQKKATDPEACAKQQKTSNERWRKNKPAHLYQSDYRETHPEYVKKNKIEQRQRNQKRQKFDSAKALKKIVKSDTFCSEIEKTDIYRMKILTPNVSEKIVKSDAFVVQLQKYQPTRS